jgi:hypothetical protein
MGEDLNTKIADFTAQDPSTDSLEMLIKEARQIQLRDRRRWAITLAVVAVVISALVIVIGSGSNNANKISAGKSTNSSISPPSTCLRSQIRVALVGDGAGLGNGASLIRVTNVSDKACSVTGYPSVTGIFASDVQRTFKDTLNGYNGGLGTDPLSRAKPPVVTLRSRHGIATSMVESVDEGVGPNPFCSGFTSFVVVLPHVTGATYTFHSRWPDLYCFQREVHPFVPGSTGDAK